MLKKYFCMVAIALKKKTSFNFIPQYSVLFLKYLYEIGSILVFKFCALLNQISIFMQLDQLVFKFCAFLNQTVAFFGIAIFVLMVFIDL